MDETITLAQLPAIKQPLLGGTFGGVITLADGKHYAVVKLDAEPPKRQSKDAQMAWAKSLGAQLITRAIGSLLVSTLGDLLPLTWVWTSEDVEDEPAYAWYCGLDFGTVASCNRSAASGAVAVRLIPLTA